MKMCPNPRCQHRVGGGLADEDVDAVETCSWCGTRLVDVVPDHPAPSPRMPGADLNMVCVLRTANEAMAALAKSILDGDGIRYLVRGESLQDLIGWGRAGGFNVVVGPAEFLVHPDDAERARALLTQPDVVASEVRESDDEA